jgi:hypothetical protein
MPISTKGLPFPKPGDVGKTKVVKLSKVAYATQRRRRWEMQSRACICGKGISLDQGELHHEDGRGLGGGKRNDLRTVMLCQDCHRKKHNQ